MAADRSEPDASRKRRVQVFLRTGEMPGTALDVGALIAIAGHMELVAVQVEVQPLTELAGLPFVMELDRVSAVSRPLTTHTLGRSLDLKRRRIAERLAELARRHGILTHSEIVHGPLWQAAVQGLQHAELVVMCGPAADRWQRPPIVARQTVAVMLTAVDEFEALMAPAAGIADRSGGRLLVILMEEDSETLVRLSEQAAQALRKLRANRPIDIVPVTDLVQAGEVITRHRCRVLVLRRGSVRFDNDWLEGYLAKPERVLILASDRSVNPSD